MSDTANTVATWTNLILAHTVITIQCYTMPQNMYIIIRMML